MVHFALWEGEIDQIISLQEGDHPHIMTAPENQGFRTRLADSLASPLSAATPRRVHGAVTLPGKATAVIGIRRSGKTTYLDQLRRERLERGVARERLVPGGSRLTPTGLDTRRTQPLARRGSDAEPIRFNSLQACGPSSGGAGDLALVLQNRPSRAAKRPELLRRSVALLQVRDNSSRWSVDL